MWRRGPGGVRNRREEEGDRSKAQASAGEAVTPPSPAPAWSPRPGDSFEGTYGRVRLSCPILAAWVTTPGPSLWSPRSPRWERRLGWAPSLSSVLHPQHQSWLETARPAQEDHMEALGSSSTPGGHGSHSTGTSVLTVPLAVGALRHTAPVSAPEGGAELQDTGPRGQDPQHPL